MDYYNEHDPYVAQWLRNLIEAGELAHGVVDERSIEDVLPSDLAGFIQCHFFAGIGGWPLALRRAGWPISRSVWTGSCPCQPFSAAGQGAAFADERHLWPAFFHLIAQCRPAEIGGEQVASKDADAWIDLVQSDLEGLGYTFAAVAFPSAGVGAPHIRDRIYWSAYAGQHDRRPQAAPAHHRQPEGHGPTDRLGGRGGLVNGAWAGAEWRAGRDGRKRPLEPGIPPVADEFSGRVEQIRAYGNALNLAAAQTYIETAML